MNNATKVACENYRIYLERILKSASESFLEKVSGNDVQLHEAFGINLFLAHAVDYIQAIRKAAGKKENRKALLQAFDTHFGVHGNRFRSRKFELIDAVNNALKHIQLDKGRYVDLVEQYGAISFNCLVPVEGRVLCILDGYRFDYSRVVLRPAIEALVIWNFDDTESVLEFALGTISFESLEACDDFDDDPIDRMINYCNPNCNDCDEPESDCQCATFIYEGEKGEFAPNFDSTFDFDGVMSSISGAYRKNS